MKSLLLTSGLIVLIFSSFLGLALYNDANNNNNFELPDKIEINSVNISDPGIVCFTIPCSFSLIELNFTVTNTFTRTLNLSNSDYYSLNIIPNSSYSDLHFGISEYHSKNRTANEIVTIPSGTWNDSYLALLSLGRMPSPDTSLPTSLQVQLTIGDGLIKSSIFSIDLKF